ncbi:MAG: Osmoregulated proline transporter OpuE [Verrucomicrobia subdivision 3 bacterium]|nr:Osmoregulated proline transporter OpuE [Limisphaerales bacterium]MCS1414047.1 Osmoregulated proline transporter OpuE [Limisphaerales bacterium]
MEDRALILWIVGLYMLCCLILGAWAARRTKSSRDFFVAGKGIGTILMGFAAFSTTMSGFGFIGGPGLVYKLGTSSFWICCPAVLGFTISTLLIAKRFRVFSALFDILTLPDAVAIRYQSELCRFLTALVILLGVIAYLGTNILAFGTVASTFFNINFTLAAVGGMTVVILYAVFGGIIAGLYTDVIQGGIMVIASAALFWIAMTTAGEGRFSAGPENLTQAFHAANLSEAVGPWGVLGPMACLAFLFLFGLGGSGQPHVITKFLMLKSEKPVRWSLLVTTLAYTLCILLWMSVGFAMKYLVITGQADPLPVGKEDQAAPVFLLQHAPAWLAGIVFSGLFAAIMSTADSFLNIGAGVFVRDIPRGFLRRTVAHELMWARIATVLLAVSATAFALWAKQHGDLIAILGTFGWGLFAAAFVPAVSIGFNWKRATWQGAAAAITVGTITNIGLDLLGKYPKETPIYKIPGSVSIGAVALMASIITLIGVSFLTKPRTLDKKLEAALDC